MRNQIVRVPQHIVHELFRFRFFGRVERRQATLNTDMAMKKLAMLSVCYAVGQKSRGATPTDEVKGQRKVWPVRRDSALLHEYVFDCFEGVKNDVLRAQRSEAHDRTWRRMSGACTLYEACMHLPYLLLMAPNALYGTSTRRSSRFPMSGHPGGPGGSGARPPDKASNKVQCQTGKADVKDVNPHDCNPVGLVYSRRSVDGYHMLMQFGSALYDTILGLERHWM